MTESSSLSYRIGAQDTSICHSLRFTNLSMQLRCSGFFPLDAFLGKKKHQIKSNHWIHIFGTFIKNFSCFFRLWFSPIHHFDCNGSTAMTAMALVLDPERLATIFQMLALSLSPPAAKCMFPRNCPWSYPKHAEAAKRTKRSRFQLFLNPLLYMIDIGLIFLLAIQLKACVLRPCAM